MIFDDIFFFQKIVLNELEYVENYADQFSAVQMIFYIAKKSIFINFKSLIKNRIFCFLCIFKKKGRRTHTARRPARSALNSILGNPKES